MPTPTTPPPPATPDVDEIEERRKAALLALMPNDNAEGLWLAKPEGGGPAWMILGPTYKSRPSRMVIATIDVDGTTNEDAAWNNQALAAYIVASVNTVLALTAHVRRLEADLAAARADAAGMRGAMGMAYRELQYSRCRCDPHPAPALRCYRCKALEVVEQLMREERESAPDCPKHPGTKMVYADGKKPYHDLKTPHWRCELWVGGGECGTTLPANRSNGETR